MAFTPTLKVPGDLVKSQDWNAAMQAILELFAKLDPATGHLHTGAPEDAPPIQQNGIADNAVVTSKISDGAVTELKLQDNAVTTTKIQDTAVSTNKIQDGAVTLSKIAAGIIPGNIGIAVTNGLANNSNIPIPTGFTKEECVFFAFPKAIFDASVIPFNCFVQDGVVKIQREGFVLSPNQPTPITQNIFVSGIAIAKKGGWQS